MKTKHRISLGLTCVVLVISGCVTAPSLTELGEESAGQKSVGTAIYVGFFGLSLRDKHEVYNRALQDALGKKSGTEKLSDVKLWESGFLGASASLPLLAYAAVLPTIMGDPAQLSLATIVFGSASVAIWGLEVTKYTVVGAPVPVE